MSTLRYLHRGAVGSSFPQQGAVVSATKRVRCVDYVSSCSRLVSRGGGFHFTGINECGQRKEGRNLVRVASGNAVVISCSAVEDGSSKCSGVLSPHTLFPLTAMALAFSRAAACVTSLIQQVQSEINRAGHRDAKDAIVEEFVEAAKGSRPWRSGLENALARQGAISLALLSATSLAHDHLNPIIATLRANPTFMSGFIAWSIAQAAKVFTYYLVVRKWDFRMVMGSGGMPSSHSALCFALTTSVAFVNGVSDALFPVCLGFTLIVMYDAAGVRRHAGRQAEVLNMIVADLFQGHPISERKLKELLGHTPLQVFAGASLGTVVGYLCSRGARVA